MAYYDEQGFSQMQLDALARMREMQKRSKTLIQEPPPFEEPNTKTISEIHINSKPQRQPTQTHNVNHHQSNINPLAGIFGGVSGIDPEKLLIVIMLYILYKNKADIKLLIALGYLLI